MQITCEHCGHPMEVPVSEIASRLECPACHRLLGVEDEENAPWTFSGALRDAIPGIGSMVFHAAVLLICALVTCDRRAGSGPDVVAEIGELPTTVLSESQEEQLDTTEAEETQETEDELLLEVEVMIPTSDAVSTSSLDVTLAQLMPTGASGGMLSEIGSPGGGSGGLGEGVSFMGVKTYGNRICIIADSSGSMSGRKLDFVKEQILETVRSLRGQKQFQLFFFNSVVVPFPYPGWRNPRRDDNLLVQFLQQTGSFGGTDPTPAFRDAFELTPPPDIIYFMTDGLFDPGVVGEVARLNTKRPKVQVHAISFIDNSSEALMRQIAEDSGGTYTHVPGF